MKKVFNRSCPICGYSGNKLLYSQKFIEEKEHKIVCCNSCGFVFVLNTPTQEEYNRYYKEMSSYEEERDHNFHSEYVQILRSNLDKNSKIIDIGCATGHLLFLLKKAGFKNIYGVDPSPACKRLAWENFKIKIGTENIFSLKPIKTYDCVILAAVLEHIEDLRRAIQVVNSILDRKGKVFITVPDAGNFHKDFEEPFGEFSVEHINFFSLSYLQSLMIGYKNIYTKTDGKALYTLWERSNDLKKNVDEYIGKSKKDLLKINKIIGKAPSRVLVWGAGSLTKRLLAETKLSSKVVVFVDRNKNLIGKKLNGKRIVSPDEIHKYPEPILISSFRFKDEIEKNIRSLKVDNEIIKFD